MIRQPNTYMTSSQKGGFVDTLALYDFYMTRKENSLDRTFNVHNLTKLGVRMEGPYTIECVHLNGNFTILLCEGITERINIRRILPYC